MAMKPKKNTSKTAGAGVHTGMNGNTPVKRARANKAQRPALTAKQEAFCVAYVAQGVAATAYRDAYDAAGMKPEVIHNEASRLLDNPEIAMRIKGLQERAAKRAEISAGRVLREYAKLAFLDIRKAFDSAGNLKPITELDDDTAAAVSGLDFEEVFEAQGSGEDRKRVHVGRIHKIKLSDKRAALDSLAKYIGMGAATGKNDQPAQRADDTGATWEHFLSLYRPKESSEPR
jgi:phage terminase small subunit